MTNKKAFTLAEVLITLGIIGVVAALTIPALMQSTNNKELVSGTLKMGTTLSNALKGMEAHDMVGVDKLANLDAFAEKFKKQLKTVNCTDHSICLADGAYFDYSNPQFGGHCDKETPCVEIVADINGKKGPNKAGKDQYTFLVTNRGVIPLGEQTTCSGLDCTAYVLANQKLWEGELTISSTPTISNDPCVSYDNEGYCLDADGHYANVPFGEPCSRDNSIGGEGGSWFTCSNGYWGGVSSPTLSTGEKLSCQNYGYCFDTQNRNVSVYYDDDKNEIIPRTCDNEEGEEITCGKGWCSSLSCLKSVM